MTIPILVSCRDPGAALQIKPIIERLKQNDTFQVHCVMAQPGHTLLGIEGTPFSPSVVTKYIFKNYHVDMKHIETAAMIKHARELIESIQPQVILTGNSALGYGVDEALIYASTRWFPLIQTVVLNDGWSRLNSLGMARPNVVLCIDDYAKKILSEQLDNVSIQTIGSPKHDIDYGDIQLLRSTFKKIHGMSEEQHAVGFFAQTHDIPGYIDNYKILTSTLAQHFPNDLFILKIHPKHTDHAEELMNVAISSGLKPHVYTSPDENPFLFSGLDVVVVCTSLIALDHAYFTSASPIPLGNVIHLLCGNDIQRHLVALSGKKTPILSDMGIGTAIFNENELVKTLGQDVCSKYYDATKCLEAHGATDRAVRAIVKLITTVKTPSLAVCPEKVRPISSCRNTKK